MEFSARTLLPIAQSMWLVIGTSCASFCSDQEHAEVMHVGWMVEAMLSYRVLHEDFHPSWQAHIAMACTCTHSAHVCEVQKAIMFEATNVQVMSSTCGSGQSWWDAVSRRF